MTKYWWVGSILAILLTGCGPEQTAPAAGTPSNDPAESKEEPMVYGPDSWKSLIPEACLHFFDGCNTCTRSPGSDIAACTRKACMTYKEPRCLDEQTSEAEFQSMSYTCDGGETFTVFRGEYRGGDMRVKLEADEIWMSDAQTRTAYRMQRVRSASGEKYSDGDISFWTKGAEAMVQKGDNVLYKACLANS